MKNKYFFNPILVINKTKSPNSKDKIITIFDGEKSLLITLNESASFMAELIIKGINYEKMIEKIVKNYGISPATARIDLNGFIEKMKKRNLLITEKAYKKLTIPISLHT